MMGKTADKASLRKRAVALLAAAALASALGFGAAFAGDEADGALEVNDVGVVQADGAVSDDAASGGADAAAAGEADAAASGGAAGSAVVGEATDVMTAEGAGEAEAEGGGMVESEVRALGTSFTNVAPLVANVAREGGAAVQGLFSAYASGIALLSDEGDGESGSGASASGLELDKKAEANTDGTYTITLEAYATGQTVTTTTTTEAPADIVLVLDLSSSMTEYMKTYSYSVYSGTNARNTSLYANRHNGGKSNLWYQVEDDYYPVSVDAQLGYTKLETSGWKNYSTGRNQQLSSSCWYYYAENLYVKIGDGCNKVTVSREQSGSGGNRTYTYTYTYIDADGNGVTVTSLGDSDSPSFANGLEFYTSGAEDVSTVYTYTYTVNGEPTVICQSEGSTAEVSGYTFYSRTSSTGTSTRLSALQTAVNSFIDSVYRKAAGADENIGTEDDIDHRIAIVGFNTSATAYTKSGSSLAFVDMNKSGVDETLKSTVNNLTTSTGTVPASGIDMANNKLFGSDTSTDRNRVVILFTDGYPSTSGSSNFTDKLANDTISETHVSKDKYGATVYTVAVLDDADPSADISSSTTLTGNTLKVNKYLHYASSNYPDATSLESSGGLSDSANPFNGGKSYYLTAADEQSLTQIFTSIASEIETGGASNTTLGSSTVVKDIISPQFTVSENTSDIKLYTADCTGTGLTFGQRTEATGVTATIAEDTLNVTGFDFSANWCGSHSGVYSGKKLIVEFTVSPEEGFLGGNNVPTNGAASGVYVGGESVANFDVPTVNVPIEDVTVSAADKNVYLLGSLTLDQIKSSVTVRCGDVGLDLSKADDNYGLESWQTAYVDIRVSYADAAGSTLDSLSGLEDDATYKVTAEVSPKTETPTSTQGTAAEAKTDTGEGKVNVFKPELTFKDSEVWYGDTAPTDYSGNEAGEAWKHGGTTSTDEGVDMLGDKPTLGLEYAPNADQLKTEGGVKYVDSKRDIPVDVTVKIGTADVTDKTRFVHAKCSEAEDDLVDGKFWLHVNTCSLTIEKAEGEGTSLVSDEYFVFDIEKDGEPYTQATVEGAGSVTITGLPVGIYAVSEDAAAAWRYTSSFDNDSVTLGNGYPCATVTCTNTLRDGRWLNALSSVVNTYGVFNGKSGAASLLAALLG